jgi:hypothetical protein
MKEEEKQEEKKELIDPIPANSFRKTDEAVVSIFSNIDVINSDGKSFRVPCIWATEEKAISYVFRDIKQEVAKIYLPLISIIRQDINFVCGEPVLNYVATAYTLYEDDMNMILSQVVSKFDNKANCKLHQISNNLGKAIPNGTRVCKYDFALTVEGVGVPVFTKAE